MGSLFAPGGGAVGDGKIGGEEEVLDQAGGEFPQVDVPYPQPQLDSILARPQSLPEKSGHRGWQPFLSFVCA